MGSVFFSKAYAKLNLTLRIAGKRPDGYHDIESVFEQVSLADELWVAMGEAGVSLRIMPPGIGLELQKDNLVLEALRMFARRVDRKVGVRVWLTKRIPVASGLGGGSSDAACMLRILNHAFGKPLSREELAELAVLLGADVPFFLEPGCRLISGKGERLGRGVAVPNGYYVILVPKERVSTKDAYEAWDASLTAPHPAFKMDVGKFLSNDFFLPVSGMVRDVLACARYLEESGAAEVSLSGSGPSTFGLYLSETKAKQAFMNAKEKGVYGISRPLRGLIFTHSVRKLYPVAVASCS
jgi:4-diphosphocytidyl-2-C-methyl-D-erythritol kinase